MVVRTGIWIAVLILGASLPRPVEAEIWRLPAVTLEPSPSRLDGTSDEPETLEQAWATALVVDRGLEAKRWDVSSATRSLHLARAQRWPLVSGEGSYTVRDNEQALRLRFPGPPLSTYVIPIDQDESFAFRAVARMPLYTCGRVQHGIAAAEAEVSAAQGEVTSFRSNLKMVVAEEYVAVLRAQREVEVAQSTVRSLEAHTRDVELLFAHERVPQNDMLAARVALSNARYRAIQADNLLDTSRAAYNRRLARPLTAELHLAELRMETEPEDVETLTARALLARPEIAALTKRIQALRHQARSLRAKSGPQFDLLGEYAFQENRFQTPQGISAVGVGVHWNVFDAGRNQHESQAVSDRAEGLIRTKADVESRIQLEVRRAWLDVHETRRRIQATVDALEQAEESLRVAKQRYTSGLGTNTEVLDAETLRTETYRNYYNATYDAAVAILRLRRAAGELK